MDCRLCFTNFKKVEGRYVEGAFCLSFFVLKSRAVKSHHHHQFRMMILRGKYSRPLKSCNVQPLIVTFLFRFPSHLLLLILHRDPSRPLSMNHDVINIFHVRPPPGYRIVRIHYQIRKFCLMMKLEEKAAYDDSFGCKGASQWF